jgi:cell division protein FtsB
VSDVQCFAALVRWWGPYFSLVESVAQLKAKNDVLTAKVDELRHEVDQQAGQVKVLIEFVRGALDDRVEKRAQAAARAVLADYEAKADTESRGERK